MQSVPPPLIGGVVTLPALPCWATNLAADLARWFGSVVVVVAAAIVASRVAMVRWLGEEAAATITAATLPVVEVAATVTTAATVVVFVVVEAPACRHIF